MSWWNPMEKAVRDAVRSALEEAGAQALQRYRDIAKVSDLKQTIADLEIQQGKKQEEWARREREIEHKVGLERKRQEFEVDQAKRETETRVREENLKADKERFKAEMDFQRKHLEGEIGSLRTLVGKMLERLPDARVIARVGNQKK